MSAVDAVSGEQILIMVGDGADTEVFAHPCLINAERGLDFSSSMSEDVIPDCASPDDPAWVSREKDGLSLTISGAGLLDVASIEDFDAWFRSGDPKNVKSKVNKAGGSTWTGAFHLSQFQITGTRKQKATCSITLVSTGPVVRADNA